MRPTVVFSIVGFVWSKIFELFDTIILRLKKRVRNLMPERLWLSYVP